MRHLHDELLAGLALGQDPPRRRDRAHLSLCRSCAGRAAELRHLVATGHAGQPYPLRPPRPGLLAAIHADIASDESASDERASDESAGDESAEDETAATGTGQPADELARRRAARPTKRRATRLAAAAAVLVVAAGGAVWYRSTASETVVATANLAPLPDHSGQGTARLVQRNGEPELSIVVTTPPPRNAFEELWLINTDGKRMISLGVVPPDGRRTYPVPAGKALDGYRIVDISIEPFDGNAEHSHNSLLRGTLS